MVYSQEYLRYIELFNAHRFFDAHEVLELLWRRETGDRRSFYQGLIQLAVAFLHLQRGNLVGARSLHAKSHARLAPFVPLYCGLDLARLLPAVDAVLGPLHKGERVTFDAAAVPRMELVRQQ